ncbi:MAG: FecR domain-containing protein, partial [Leptospiraceae bacterium]|nr:FecR domain-containing protein [Leptospiraceae bacterium]
TIDLESGQLFGKVKNIPKGSKVTITTPTFTGGVRGTEFAFSEGNSGDDSDQLEDGVFVTEGSVEVKRNDSPKTVTVKAGQQILSKSKEILVGILDDHNKKKMRILQTIQVMKEENYQLLQKQLEKNKEILKK